MAVDFSTETATLIPVSPAAQSTVSRGINIKRLIRMRWRLMVGVALALAAPLLVAVALLIPREYSAVAAIRFARTKPTILSPNQQMAVSSDYGTYVETNVNLIRGAAVLGKVVERADVRGLDLVTKQRDPVFFLERKMDVRVVPNSELVSVGFQSPDRQTALTIVSAVVDEFLKHATSADRTSMNQVTQQLEEEADTLEQNVASLSRDLADAREKMGVAITSGGMGIDPERQSYYESLSKALSDKTTAEYLVQQAEAQLRRIEELIEKANSNPNDPIYEFNVENLASADPAVLVQSQQLAEKDARLALVQGKYVDGHPALKNEEDARRSVAAALEKAKQGARLRALMTVQGQSRLELEKARKLVEDAAAREAGFQEELKKHASESIEVAKAFAELRERENSLDDARASLRDVREKIRVLRADSRVAASYSVAATAQAPVTPDSKRRFRFMMLVGMFSCGCGLALGLWRELSDQQVRTAQDLRYVTDLPLMAMIPHSSAERLPSNSRAALLTADHPDSISADEFRRVLSRIIYPPEGAAELNTVLVTSPSRGDGKTSLACNLAISLAQANRRVLLLDVCARRPGIEANLGMERSIGLGEIFTGTHSIQDAVRPTNYPNLAVLGPGYNGVSVIGKLASRETVEFLEKAEEAFEHVIIDTPPVLLMADAKLLAPVVDGVIMVVGAEVSSLGMVKRALQELQQIGSNIIGVVLNRAKHVPGGYMREVLDSYYNYEKDGHRSPNGKGEHHVEETAVEGDSPSIMLLEETANSPKRNDA